MDGRLNFAWLNHIFMAFSHIYGKTRKTGQIITHTSSVPIYNYTRYSLAKKRLFPYKCGKIIDEGSVAISAGMIAYLDWIVLPTGFIGEEKAFISHFYSRYYT